jgi:hypothetical protein
MESHINSFGFLFNEAESIFHARVDMGTQMACLGAYTSRATIFNMIAWHVESRGKNVASRALSFFQPSQQTRSALTVTATATSSQSTVQPHFRRTVSGKMASGDSTDSCESCSLVPLTTTFTPPASYTKFWTLSNIEDPASNYILLTRASTPPECLPSQYSAGCRTDCTAQSVYRLSNVSPGVCPDGCKVAKTIIQDMLKTQYCCPP